jgi:membrane protein DedA with SNARE-associated domain
MPIALVFFIHYAYLIIFLWVLVEQVGVPIPSIPMLLTAGTLTATHRISHLYALGAVLLACLPIRCGLLWGGVTATVS